MRMTYKRLGIFHIEDVLKHNKAIGTPDSLSRVKFTTEGGNTYDVNMNSLRQQVFNESRVCCDCGIEGQYMALERCKNERPHFNMYAVKDGKEVLMTKGCYGRPGGHRTTCEHCMNKYKHAMGNARKEAAAKAKEAVEND